MRKLMWFTIGFGAACAFCAYLDIGVFLTLPTGILSAMLCFYSRKRPLYHRAALTAVGLILGLFWFARFEGRMLQPAYELDGVTREATIISSGYGEKTDYGIRTEGRTQIGKRWYPVLCYLDEETAVEPGMVLSGSFRFQVTAPGGGKASSYHQGEGIFLLAYQKDEILLSPGEESLRNLPAKLRREIVTILDSALELPASAFAKALLLGDSEDLGYATLSDFSVSGIRHIIAVSGLHVSILFSLLGVLTFRRRFLTALVGLPSLLLFAAVAGFSPSVSRACIMSALMLTSLLLNREYDGPTALSFAALTLLLVNPLVIVSVSYQLSFASVAGIFLFSPGIHKWLISCCPEKGGRFRRSLIRWFTVGVSVTLGATTATAPLCALYFGTISLLGVLTNLLVLWAISIIFYGLMALCLMHGLWPAGAVFFGKLLSVLIHYVLTVAKVIGDIPLAAVYTRSPYIVAWLIFVYVLLAVFLLSKNRQPVTLSCCAALGLCVAMLASWAEPLMDDVRFTVLDVGQGQCLLLQSEGKTYMVDCGGDSDGEAADLAAETLLSQGITKLDALILTHGDRDHAGGVENLLSRVSAEMLILPSATTEFAFPSDHVLFPQKEMVLESGETKIRIFPSEIPGDGNENSFCILFDTKKCDILVTGDRSGFGERMLLRYADIPHVDVLVAGHHGSKNSTCEELLTTVRPEIVCISAGEDNYYGHPAPELLQRLQSFGCTVYRTDLHGDIIIRR